MKALDERNLILSTISFLSLLLRDLRAALSEHCNTRNVCSADDLWDFGVRELSSLWFRDKDVAHRRVAMRRFRANIFVSLLRLRYEIHKSHCTKRRYICSIL